MSSLTIPRGSVISFIASQPDDLDPLKLQNEQGELARKWDHHFEIKTQFAARPEDLVTALGNHKPTVLHFAGHGGGEKGLAMESTRGKTTLVSTRTLDLVLAEKSLSQRLRLVVLNACWSLAQAQAIIEKVPAVIAMNESVLDTTAAKFTAMFYEKLAQGKSIKDAFDQAMLTLEIKKTADRHVPVLLENERLILQAATLNLPAWNSYLTQSFSILDLQSLCALHFEEFHNLHWKPNAGMGEQSLNFLSYIRNRKKLPELCAALRQTRGAEFAEVEHTLFC